MSATALASGILKVPVIIKPPRKEQTALQKKMRAEKRRKVLRDRAANLKKYRENAQGVWNDYLGQFNAHHHYCCKCLAGFYQVIAGGIVKQHTLGGVGCSMYIPGAEPKTFRRQVSSGETVEAFNGRLEREMRTMWAQGFSFVDEACHCSECMRYRKQAYSYLSNVNNEVEKSVARNIAAWDAEYNPFSPTYRHRRAPVRSARSVSGNDRNRRPQGAGSGGSMYSDKGAKLGAARLVGVEVEHNKGVDLSKWISSWNGAQVITDGSCGYEAVTPPIAGANVRACLTQLMKELNDRKAGCDSRCGLHIHVDARDMRWQDMLRFLTVYSRLEPLLFLIGGQNRYSNRGGYCSPVAKLYEKALRQPDPKGAVLAAAVLSDNADYLASSNEGRETMKQNPGKKGGGRYKAINIMPWVAGRAYQRADTTVEFRLHRGSHSAERVIHWAYICQDIVDWCIRSSNSDVEKLPKSAARVLCQISPRCKGWVIRRLLGWRKATTAGTSPLEDDVGNIIPRRIVTVRNGMYSADMTRLAPNLRDYE